MPIVIDPPLIKNNVQKVNVREFRKRLCFECLTFRLLLNLSVNGQIAIQLFRNFDTFFIENDRMAIWLDISKYKLFIFLSVNGWMVIQMSYVWPNCHLAVHTQTQTQTQTEGYRMQESEGKTIQISRRIYSRKHAFPNYGKFKILLNGITIAWNLHIKQASWFVVFVLR